MSKDKYIDRRIHQILKNPTEHTGEPVSVWADSEFSIDGFVVGVITENGNSVLVVQTENYRKVTCREYWNIQPMNELRKVILEAHDQLALDDLDKCSGSKESTNRRHEQMVKDIESDYPEVAEYLDGLTPRKPDSVKGRRDPERIMEVRREVTIARIEGASRTKDGAFTVVAKLLNMTPDTVDKYYYDRK